jgi:hypothetical protein
MLCGRVTDDGADGALHPSNSSPSTPQTDGLDNRSRSGRGAALLPDCPLSRRAAVPRSPWRCRRGAGPAFMSRRASRWPRRSTCSARKPSIRWRLPFPRRRRWSARAQWRPGVHDSCERSRRRDRVLLAQFDHADGRSPPMATVPLHAQYALSSDARRATRIWRIGALCRRDLRALPLGSRGGAPELIGASRCSRAVALSRRRDRPGWPVDLAPGHLRGRAR